MENRNGIRITQILLPLAGGAFALSMATWLRPCAPMEDGGWMTCHWAGQMEIALAVLMTVIGVMNLVLRQKAGAGLVLSIVPLSILTALVPKHLIPLCMMETMRCQSLTRPGAIAFSVLMLILALVDLWLQHRS